METANETIYVSCADTAKLVRAALKAAFPGVTFSVKSKTYSGGASIDIAWMDGPTSPMVEATISHLKGATFDGMIDLKSNVYTMVDGKRTNYGADFIFTRRAFSRAHLENAAQWVAERYGVPVATIKESSHGAYIDRDAHEVRVPTPAMWLSSEVLARAWNVARYSPRS